MQLTLLFLTLSAAVNALPAPQTGNAAVALAPRDLLQEVDLSSLGLDENDTIQQLLSEVGAGNVSIEEALSKFGLDSSMISQATQTLGLADTDSIMDLLNSLQLTLGSSLTELTNALESLVPSSLEKRQGGFMDGLDLVDALTVNGLLNLIDAETGDLATNFLTSLGLSDYEIGQVTKQLGLSDASTVSDLLASFNLTRDSQAPELLSSVNGLGVSKRELLGLGELGDVLSILDLANTASVDQLLGVLNLSGGSQASDLLNALGSVGGLGLSKRDLLGLGGILSGLGLSDTASVDDLLAALGISGSSQATSMLSSLNGLTLSKRDLLSLGGLSDVTSLLDLPENASIDQLIASLGLSGDSQATDLLSLLNGVTGSKRDLLGLGLLDLSDLDIAGLDSLLSQNGLSQSTDMGGVLDTMGLTQSDSVSSLLSGLGIQGGAFDDLLANDGLSSGDGLEKVFSSVGVTVSSTLGDLLSSLGILDALQDATQTDPFQ